MTDYFEVDRAFWWITGRLDALRYANPETQEHRRERDALRQALIALENWLGPQPQPQGWRRGLDGRLERPPDSAEPNPETLPPP